MKKKFLAMAAALSMMTVLLAGCGRKVPTAEELMEQVYGDALLGNADADVSLTVGMTAQGVSMDDFLTADLGMQMSDGVCHMAGTMTVNLFGEVTVDAESYAILDGDTVRTYSKDAETGMWSVSEEESTESLAGIPEGTFYDMELEGPEDGADGYVVHAKASAGDSVDLGKLAGAGADAGEMDCTFVFDADTKKLSSFSISADADVSEDGMEGSVSVSLTFVINKIGGVEVVIPQDVIDSAEEYGGYDSSIF